MQTSSARFSAGRGADDNVPAIPPSAPRKSSGDGLEGARGAPSDAASAARQLLDDLTAGREADPRALAIVIPELTRTVRRIFPDIDADDVVQSTIARLLHRPERIAADEIENPWGYLVGAARNAAIDAIRKRKRRREVEIDAVPDSAAPEDSVAELVERNATHAAVVAAMRELVDAGDDFVVPIVTKWLDVADELGRAPSTRQVAARTDVSHTSVATALRRFRDTLARHL